MLDREGAEASQLHSLSAGKRERYFFEDRGDDGLYILAAQMRISRRQLRDQFRFCQGFPGVSFRDVARWPRRRQY